MKSVVSILQPQLAPLSRLEGELQALPALFTDINDVLTFFLFHNTILLLPVNY